MDPRHYHAAAHTLDGEPFTLRAIRADDKRRLDRHFHALSPESVQQRFFQGKKDLTEADLVHLTELDFTHHLALVATLPGEDGDEVIVGVGRAIEGPEDGGCRTAEVAFAVADAHQNRGLGRQLLAHLAVAAREVGIQRFEAWMLSENARMLDVFLRSGFEVRRALEDGAIHVVFAIDPACASPAEA
jgi:GNAT superfamily N-acetyltransferase